MSGFVVQIGGDNQVCVHRAAIVPRRPDVEAPDDDVASAALVQRAAQIAEVLEGRLMVRPARGGAGMIGVL